MTRDPRFTAQLRTNIAEEDSRELDTLAEHFQTSKAHVIRRAIRFYLFTPAIRALLETGGEAPESPGDLP